AEVVRRVYQRYTVEHLSIGAIARLLNEQGVPTRKRVSRWCRSMVWAILRNPAYKGTACFGKTEIRPRQRVTRPLRMRGGVADRNSANHERPRKEWIEIPVPAIVSGETFSLAQELLTSNKTHAPRRTIRPSICQGMVSCSKCGYALYRTSARTSARKIYYYRCLGSDGWRYVNGAVCNNPPIREEAKMPSSFAIRYRSHPHQATTSHPNPANLAPQRAKVIFCVQGVITPPCGEPSVAWRRSPS